MSVQRFDTTDRVDEEMQARVKRSLANRHPALGKLAVSAFQGTVRLSGLVALFYVRQLALSATRSVDGVNQVVDDIEVLTPANPTSDRKPR